MQRGLLAILAILWGTTIFSQEEAFIEVSESLGFYFSFLGPEYGTGVSLYDVDSNGWDDITICQENFPVQVYFNNEGEFGQPVFVGQNTQFENVKSMCWVDFDNDGDADLALNKFLGPPALYRKNGEFEFIEITANAGINMAPQSEGFGQSWGDVNRDGLLDWYICNYNDSDIPNLLYLNNGNGTFSLISDASSNGFNYTFQSMFTDIDQDLWPELYVINDRQGTVNACYQWQDDQYVNIAPELELDIDICSMNASHADYDLDGDFDIYVSNTHAGNYLHKMMPDGYYVNAAEPAGVEMNDFCWSAQWMDFDLDGDEDLHVCVTPFGGSIPSLEKISGRFNGSSTISLTFFT
ncbi:MAG: VCBS repeat-containing protein, partial [Flavobacteriales bacterium]|nr:VCBS repeat-containing protein [Flavobacteriales bacterium]